MSFISLFDDSRAMVATSRQVFSQEEVAPLESLLEQASRLAELFDRQAAREREACDTARERGYQEGLAAGAQEAAIQQAERLSELERTYAEAEATLRDTIVPLSLEVVRRIAAEVAPATWLYAAARTAADKLVDTEGLRLRIAPAEHHALTRRWNTDRDTPFVNLEADDSLAASVCVLVGRHGQVEINLARQLEHLEALYTHQEQGL